MDIRQLRDDPATFQILEERARSLALQDTALETVSGEEVLTFRLGESNYSLPAEFIREVQPLGKHTRLPSAPPFVVGLVNVRGRLLTALDIRPLLEIDPAPPQPSAMLLIVAANGVEVGLLADQVIEVRRGTGDLAPTPSAAAGRGVAWVRGVDQALSLLLDPCLLLNDTRLIVNDEVE